MNRLEKLRTELEELAKRRDDERAELLGLADAEDLTEDQEARWAELEPRFEARDGQVVWAEDGKLEELRGQFDRLRAIAEAPESARIPAVAPRNDEPKGGLTFLNRTGLDEIHARPAVNLTRDEARSAAMFVLEDGIKRRHALTASEAEAAERRMARTIDPDGKLFRHMVAASRPEYERGFTKYMQSGTLGLCTPDELRAFDEVRAIGLGSGAGGELVPTLLDPTVLDSSTAHVMGPWRQVANVVSITADNWNGVSSAGVSASMVGEATEATDDAPTFAQPTISVKKAHAFIPMSIEVMDDAAGSLVAEVRNMLAVAKMDLEDAQFAVGSGSGNNVEGIVTGLVAGSRTLASSTSNAFVIGDVYGLEETLPQNWRSRGVWMGTRTIFNEVRQFDTSGGAGLWERIGNGMPARLLDYPVYETGSMDSTYGSGENYVLIFGDISSCYYIVDRVGLSIEVIPHVFGTTGNRPTGQRGIYAWWRFGAAVVNDAPCLVLNVT